MHKVRRTKQSCKFISSLYPSIWAIHVQTVTDNVSKMNRCIFKVKNKVVLVVVGVVVVVVVVVAAAAVVELQ
jgi:hypothetical protein